MDTKLTLRLLLLLLLLPLAAAAQSTDELLLTLDREMDDSERYTRRKEARLDSLKLLLRNSPEPERQYQLLRELIHEYSNFHIDSTFTYLLRAEQLATDMGDADRMEEVKILNAWNYMQDGDLLHPTQYMDRLDIQGGPDWLKATYYNIKVRVYSVLVGLLRDPKMRREYNRILLECRDSAYHYSDDNWMMLGDILSARGELKAGIDTITHRLAQPHDDSVEGIAYHFLARIYGQQENVDKRKECLVRSALADLRSGTREYASLVELAVMLYDEGDSRRAYRYIARSMIDANLCHSKLRMVQISDDMPVITASYISQEKRSKELYQCMLWGITAFVVILLALAAVLNRQKRQLRRMHRDLDFANTKLKEANAELSNVNLQLSHTNDDLTKSCDEQHNLIDQLSAADQTKHVYVHAFMHLSLDYLSRMEAFRKEINRVAQHRNFDELAKAVRAGRDISEEVEMFYSCFDEAFLNIHPHFIEQFNQLLRPEEQLQLQEGERMNTELRLYALMLLGVTDATEVCNFLRCSSSTVYNYRTKMRNRAINRDTFEADVLQIP